MGVLPLMSTLLLTLAILLSLCCPISFARKEICKMKKGLPCFSSKTLMPGSSFTVASKTCKKGRYPKQDYCLWYFDVGNCTPSLHCDKLDIRGKGKKCKGDRLTVLTENGKTPLCGKKQKDKNFTPKQATNFFDIEFTTNKRQEGSGFKCTVSCSGENPEPLSTAGPCMPHQRCIRQSTAAPPPPPTTKCQCGLPNRVQRIVGGVETEINEYPWQIGLVNPGDDLPFCGGAILSSLTIITAAHCTRGSSVSSFDVVVAEHDVTIDDGQERFRVCSIAEHPNYDRNTNDHDLSILTLCNPITFKREASPVCLPSQPGSSYDGVVSTVSGWGTLSSGGYQPDELMEVNVTTIDNTECNTAYGGDITDNMICAKGDRKDACQGDSGGPLITREPGNFYSLIGIVSWGIGCANPLYPGVYARVTKDLTWIMGNVKGEACA